MTPPAARVWAGPAAATALEALSLAVGFGTQLLLMRALGPAGYGQCVLAVAVGVGISTLTDFGFNFAGTRLAVQWADDEVRRHRLFWAVAATKCAVAAAALAVVALLPATQALWPAAAISAAGAVFFPNWYLLARGRFLTAAGSLLAGRVVTLGAIAAWIGGPEHAVLGSVLNCVAPLVAAILACTDADLRRVLRPCRLTVEEVIRAVRLGASAVWINAVPALGTAMVQAMIGHFGSHATLGQYAAADKVRAAIQGLFNAFGQALYPASVAAAHRQAHQDRRPALVLLALASLAAAPLAIVPELVVTLAAGSNFEEAASALRVMSLAVISSTGVTALGLLFLLARGRDHVYAFATAAGLVVQAAALALLVPRHGATGAAVALWLADLAALAIMLPTLRRG